MFLLPYLLGPCPKLMVDPLISSPFPPFGGLSLVFRIPKFVSLLRAYYVVVEMFVMTKETVMMNSMVVGAVFEAYFVLDFMIIFIILIPNTGLLHRFLKFYLKGGSVNVKYVIFTF